MAEIEEVKALLEQEFGAEAVTDLGGGSGVIPDGADPERAAPHPVPERKATDTLKNRVVTTIAAPLLNSVGGGDGEDSQPQPPAPDYISKFSFEKKQKPVKFLSVQHLKDLLRHDRPPPVKVFEFFHDNQLHCLGYKGEIIRFAGDGGTGKSFFLLDLLLSEQKVAGVKANADRVMWVDEEHDSEICSERFMLLGQDPEKFHSRMRYALDNNVRLDVPDSRDALFEAVGDWKPDIIVLDSFSALSMADENDNLAQRNLYKQAIAPLSRTFGATVVVIDHVRKPGQYDNNKGNPDYRVRGAGDKINQIERSWVAVGVGDNEFVLQHGKVRRGGKPPKIHIRRVLSTDGKRLTHQFVKVIDDA